jgi:hypothetical protein
LKCVSCHATAESSERASFPEAQKCQVCHATLDVPKNQKITPEKPIYALPDFVFFSHAKHKTGCTACHGGVWANFKMKDCVDCHKSKKAPVACNVCHDLSP